MDALLLLSITHTRCQGLIKCAFRRRCYDVPRIIEPAFGQRRSNSKECHFGQKKNPYVSPFSMIILMLLFSITEASCLESDFVSLYFLQALDYELYLWNILTPQFIFVLICLSQVSASIHQGSETGNTGMTNTSASSYLGA